MDREVIEQKLESLRHCLRRIEAKCPAQAQTLATDPDLQDIVALNLSRAVTKPSTGTSCTALRSTTWSTSRSLREPLRPSATRPSAARRRRSSAATHH